MLLLLNYDFTGRISIPLMENIYFSFYHRDVHIIMIKIPIEKKTKIQYFSQSEKVCSDYVIYVLLKLFKKFICFL